MAPGDSTTFMTRLVYVKPGCTTVKDCIDEVLTTDSSSISLSELFERLFLSKIELAAVQVEAGDIVFVPSKYTTVALERDGSCVVSHDFARLISISEKQDIVISPRGIIISLPASIVSLY